MLDDLDKVRRYERKHEKITGAVDARRATPGSTASAEMLAGALDQEVALTF
jgi:hypothetical protein